MTVPAVNASAVFSDPDRRTPTYTKPMLCEKAQEPRELNRLDIKNRAILSPAYEQKVIEALTSLWPDLNALLVLDQVSEANCGVITDGVRLALHKLADSEPAKWVLGDSRERIGLFRAVCLKPNQVECLRATSAADVPAAALALARQCGRAVFCTQGQDGALLAEPTSDAVQLVPGFAVAGPIDTVGAGDSTSAGIACGLAAGASLMDAAAFGNLVASITIQQLGTTGTASPGQIRARWRQVSAHFADSAD
jgi:bifunctional ADP-heptose synthase (sugar kinase/adenylyltransferase)